MKGFTTRSVYIRLVAGNRESNAYLFLLVRDWVLWAISFDHAKPATNGSRVMWRWGSFDRWDSDGYYPQLIVVPRLSVSEFQRDGPAKLKNDYE